MHRKWRQHVLTVLMMLGLLAWPGHAAAKKTEPSPNPMKHIIVVSIDGLSQETYLACAGDNMKELARDGSATDRCLTVRSETIEAAEASLLTGSLPEEHMHFSRKDPVSVESMLDVMLRSGNSVLVVDGSGGRLRGFARGQNQYAKLNAITPDQKVLDKAADLFIARRPYFTYVYLNDCRSPMIDQRERALALARIDAGIGRWIQLLKERSIYEQSAVILVSSRSSSDSDLGPLVIRAPGLKSRQNLAGSSIIDIAPTLCALADLEAPRGSSGLTLWNAMQRPEAENSKLAEIRLEELQNERLRVWQRYNTTVKERDRYSHQMEEIKEERENVFHFAGERERTIGLLRDQLNRFKGIIAGMTIFFLCGYLIEYRILKKKFLLFK